MRENIKIAYWKFFDEIIDSLTEYDIKYLEKNYDVISEVLSFQSDCEIETDNIRNNYLNFPINKLESAIEELYDYINKRIK